MNPATQEAVPRLDIYGLAAEWTEGMDDSRARGDLLQRLKKTHLETGFSAFYEALLWRHFSQYARVEFSPDLSGLTPDFLVRPTEGPSFVLEARTIYDTLEQQRHDEKLAILRRRLMKRLPSGSTSLEFLFDGNLPEDLDMKRAVAAIASRIRSPEPGQKQSEPIDVHDLGVSCTIRTRNDGLGCSLGPVIMGDDSERIRNYVRQKAKRYPPSLYPDMGLVIAICHGGGFRMSRDSVMNAFYGTEGVTFNVSVGGNSDELDPRPFRALNGTIRPPQRDQPVRNTRISGLLYCELHLMGTSAHYELSYLANPFAAIPVSASAFPDAARFLFHEENGYYHGVWNPEESLRLELPR